MQLLSLRREGLEDIGSWPQASDKSQHACSGGSTRCRGPRPLLRPLQHLVFGPRNPHVFNKYSGELGGTALKRTITKALALAPLCLAIPSFSVQAGCRVGLFVYTSPGSETWAICCSAAAKSLGRSAQQRHFQAALCILNCLASNPSFSGSCSSLAPVPKIQYRISIDIEDYKTVKYDITQNTTILYTNT